MWLRLWRSFNKWVKYRTNEKRRPKRNPLLHETDRENVNVKFTFFLLMIEKVFFSFFFFFLIFIVADAELSMYTWVYFFGFEDVTIDKRHLFVVQKESTIWGSSKCSLRQKNFLITIFDRVYEEIFRWGFTIVFSLFLRSFCADLPCLLDIMCV